MEYPKTTGGEPQNYNMNFYQVRAQQGWQCPICKRVLAPFVPECPCSGQGMKTFTTVNVGGKQIFNNETLNLNSKGEKQ